MRRSILFVALLAACALALAQADKDAKSTPAEQKKAEHKAASTGNSAVKDAVMDAEKKLREATLKNDADAVPQFLASDYHSISAVDGQAHTKDDVVKNLKQGNLKYQSIDVSDEDVQVFEKDLAIAHGVADVKLTMNGKDGSGKYHFSRTWLKRNGKWQAVWFQTTRMP